MVEKLIPQDLDIVITMRSSKMSVAELTKITRFVLETLQTLGQLNLVEQNIHSKKTLEKELSTVITTFQSED